MTWFKTSRISGEKTPNSGLSETNGNDDITTASQDGIMARVRRFFIRYCDQMRTLSFWLYIVASVLIGGGAGAWLMQKDAQLEIAGVRRDAADWVFEANARLADAQADNKALLEMINGKLAVTSDKVADAAAEANKAANAARSASATAKGAATAAARAAIKETVIIEVEPKEPEKQDPPEWLLNGG